MSAAADDRRFLTDLLCKRLVRSDFQSGDLPRDPQVHTIKAYYRDRLADELITDEEWEDVCSRVVSWQEQEEEQAKPILSRILSRFNRFPPIARVAEILGPQRAAVYRAALETIENDMATYSQFPSDFSSYPWRKFDMDAAVSVVAAVIAPHIGDEAGMAAIYHQFVCELRARRRERSNITSAEFVKRKSVVRALGIWFPITKDIDKWKSDPRTCKIMPEFLSVMAQVVDRMRLVRSFLQHIPRRRLSTRACADLPTNLNRMKVYLAGYA